MPGRRDVLGLLAASAAVAFGTGVKPALAVGDATLNRIALAGRQRMLSQRLSRAALFMALEVERKTHLNMLKRSRSLFDRTLKGLRSGDEGLNLPAATAEPVVAAIAEVESVWTQFDQMMAAIVDRGSVEEQEISAIARLNPTLLDLSNKVVSELTLLQDGSGTIVELNVAARQRMLTQKMAKEAALIVVGFESIQNQINLKKTRDLFEASHSALLYGLPSIQLPPPAPAVKAKLEEADVIWAEYRETVDRVIETGIASSYDLTRIAIRADTLMDKMNEAVAVF